MADYDPIQISLNDKPRAILRGMDDLIASSSSIQDTQKKRRRFPLMLFLAGFPFILIDMLIRAMGYRVCAFSFVAPICWFAALVTLIVHRSRRSLKISPQYQTAREIIHTLRDDGDPKRNFFGHIDLTGTQLPSKVARETTNAFGQVTQQFRDEWLSIKAKLYDGNMLRLSAVQRDKVRKGYWKRSMSGKSKWKSPKSKGSLHEIKVRISANPEIYDTLAIQGLPPGSRIGAYTVEKFEASGGIVNMLASSFNISVSAEDILRVLKATYDQLQRKPS